MPDLLTLEGLAILLAILPGYVAVTMWARSKTWERPTTDLRTVLLAIIFSAIIEISLAPLTIPWVYAIRDKLADHPWRVAAWASVCLILLPAVFGTYGGRWSDRIFGEPLRREGATPTSVAPETQPVGGSLAAGLLRSSRSLWSAFLGYLRVVFPPSPPTIWDMFFIRKLPHGRFLVITFDDGNRVGGAYFGESFAATSPQIHGIFLLREWALDAQGNLTSPIPGSAGVLVLNTDHIVQIRVLEDQPHREVKTIAPTSTG